MSRLGFVDPAKIVCRTGPFLITGWGKGEILSIKYNSAAFALLVGAGGDATRSKLNDRSAKIELKILQTSANHSQLMSLLIADRVSGLGTFPMEIVDLLNGESYLAAQAWCEKIPDAAHGDSDQGRTWMIETNDLQPIAPLRFI